MRFFLGVCLVLGAAPLAAQKCDSKLRDLRYPAASELADTVRMGAFLEARAGGKNGTTAITLGYKEDGSLEGVDGIVPLSPAQRAALRDSILPYLVLPQPPVGKPWFITLGKGWWSQGTVEVLPVTLTCEPVLLNRSAVNRLLDDARRSLDRADQAAAGGRSATLLLGILADGTVRYAQVQQSTGFPKVDSVLVEAAKTMQFSPAQMGATAVRLLRAQRISFP